MFIVRSFSREITVGPTDVSAFRFIQPFLLPISAEKETELIIRCPLCFTIGKNQSLYTTEWNLRPSLQNNKSACHWDKKESTFCCWQFLSLAVRNMSQSFCNHLSFLWIIMWIVHFESMYFIIYSWATVKFLHIVRSVLLVIIYVSFSSTMHIKVSLMDCFKKNRSFSFLEENWPWLRNLKIYLPSRVWGKSLGRSIYQGLHFQ